MMSAPLLFMFGTVLATAVLGFLVIRKSSRTEDWLERIEAQRRRPSDTDL